MAFCVWKCSQAIDKHHTHACTQLAHAFCIYNLQMRWAGKLARTPCVRTASTLTITNWNFYIFVRRISFNACNAIPCHTMPCHMCVALHCTNAFYKKCCVHRMLMSYCFVSFCFVWILPSFIRAKNEISFYEPKICIREMVFVNCFFFTLCVSNVRANAKMYEFKFHQPKMLSKKCRLPQNVCNIFIFATSNGVFAAYSFAKVSFGKVWTNETGCNCVTSQAVYKWTKYHRLLESRGFI